MNAELTSTPVANKHRVNARQRRRAIVHGLQNVLLVIMLLVILMPIALMLLTSLRPRTDIVSSTAPLFPEELHFENYAEMWSYIKFGPLFRNSLVVVSITTVVATFFAAMAGYALARFRFPGADTYGLVVMGTQLIPGTLFFIPLYLTFLWLKNTFGMPLVGSNFGAIVLYIGFYTPISLWILRGFFASIPPDLEEQAMVDGATRFEAFLKISLPLAKPGIVSTAIYVFMTAWDEMFFAYILGVKTVPVGIRQFVQGAAGTQVRYDYIAAASVVITIPVALMFFLLQKHFIRGLTAGAVK